MTNTEPGQQDQNRLNHYQNTYLDLRQRIMAALDAEAVHAIGAQELSSQISKALDTMIDEQDVQVPLTVRAHFTKNLIDEIKGLGPLQPLINDPDISDIMVNGPDCIYIERKGKLERSDITFIDHEQLQTIARRIAADAGRRVDEASPLCDARLPDGSRVNIAIPPIALDGAVISIRKFSTNRIELEKLVQFGSLSEAMGHVLAIAARCRLNILISGGTGSGKTTLLNALSRHIASNERIITIEDAAELQLQQPHVVRLETRPPGIENTGAINQRDLVINALRMRPDRIIIGECRGTEAFEMLQAMNTGHDGSMSTLHANTPRDALARLESLVMMAMPNLPATAIRRNIVSAVDLVIQISRLHDGSRKVMSISEVMGIEGEQITLEEIFFFQQQGCSDEEIHGEFQCTGLLERSILTKKSPLLWCWSTARTGYCWRAIMIWLVFLLAGIVFLFLFLQKPADPLTFLRNPQDQSSDMQRLALDARTLVKLSLIRKLHLFVTRFKEQDSTKFYSLIMLMVISSCAALWLRGLHFPDAPVLVLIPATLTGTCIIAVLVHRHRQRKIFNRTFPDALNILASAISSGESLNHAITYAGKSLKGPVGEEFKLIGQRLSMGQTASDVLARSCVRFPYPEFVYLVVILRANISRGGQLKDIINNLNQQLITRQIMQRKKEAMTSEARMSARIIFCVPFLFLIFMKYMSPDSYYYVMNEPAGLQLLYYMIGSELTGMSIIWLMINRVKE